MIGKAYKLGTGFKGLAAYLERGHLNELDPERVAWIEARNLPTDDPEAAARLMAASARDSERCVKPVYHLSISFDPGDPVNRETMRRVADRTLRDLGLTDHQALLVAHRDREHPHVHIVVNRVHPERRTAWSNSWDYRRIEQSLRAQEAELGLRAVPGKHAPVPEQARERIRPAPERVRGDAGFVERVRAQAGPQLTAARSWGELERGLAGHGLSLRMKGRGMVVTDGSREVKASEIDPEASRYRLERRLGLYSDYRARQAVASRTLEERTPLRGLEDRVRRLRESVRSPSGPAHEAIPTRIKKPAPEPIRVPAAKVEHRRIAASYREGMQRLYLTPRNAHARFRDALLRDGREAAVRTLQERPQAFGALRHRGAPDPVRVRDTAQEAYRWAGRIEARGRPELRRAAAELRQLHACDRYSEARMDVEHARHALADVKAHRASFRGRVRNAAHAAESVYQNPREALGRIARSARRVGVKRTADQLRTVPERFGELLTVERPRYWGFVTEYDTAPARQEAHAAASYVQWIDRSRAGSPGDVLRAREALERAERHLGTLPRVLPDRRALERVGRLLHSMERAGVNVAARLVPMLPAGAAGLVKTAVSLGKDLMMGRDQERERGRGGLSL